jgi:hypothetical protein
MGRGFKYNGRTIARNNAVAALIEVEAGMDMDMAHHHGVDPRCQIPAASFLLLHESAGDLPALSLFGRIQEFLKR